MLCVLLNGAGADRVTLQAPLWAWLPSLDGIFTSTGWADSTERQAGCGGLCCTAAAYGCLML